MKIVDNIRTAIFSWLSKTHKTQNIGIISREISREILLLIRIELRSSAIVVFLS